MFITITHNVKDFAGIFIFTKKEEMYNAFSQIHNKIFELKDKYICSFKIIVDKINVIISHKLLKLSTTFIKD